MLDDCASRKQVTVIGLGAMGATLARAFILSHFHVTVWNRTQSRAVPLVAAGAAGAQTLAGAVAASDLIVVCTIDKRTAIALFAAADAALELRGKTVVNLATGSVEDARMMSAQIEQRGGQYLDGGIMCYPRDIGKAFTTLLYSGNAGAFANHETSLRVLGGGSRFLGPDPATATTLYLALYAFYFGCVTSFFEGAALAERADVRPGAFRETAKMMISMLETALEDATDRIEADNFSGTEATVDVHHAGQIVVRDAYLAEQLDCPVTQVYLAQLEKARTRGDGASDIAAMYLAMTHR